MPLTRRSRCSISTYLAAAPLDLVRDSCGSPRLIIVWPCEVNTHTCSWMVHWPPSSIFRSHTHSQSLITPKTCPLLHTHILHIVLCYHSPGWISLAFGQDSLHLDVHSLSLYVALLPVIHNIITPILAIHLLPLLITPSCYFASVWPEPPVDHIIGSFPQHHQSCMHIWLLAWSYGSYHSGDKVWDIVEGETIEILSRDKVSLRDNRSATHRKTGFKTWCSSVNVSSFLDLYTHI